MKYITTAVSMMLLMLTVVAAVGQSSNPKPAPELKQWEIWIGDWDFSGTAKDTQMGPEYNFDWHMHGRWILDQFFGQIDNVVKENGTESRSLEILSTIRSRRFIPFLDSVMTDGLGLTPSRSVRKRLLKT